MPNTPHSDPWIRPTPLPSCEDILPLGNRVDLRRLREDRPQILQGRWADALSLLGWLKKHLEPMQPIRSFAENRAHQEEIRTITSRLAVPVENGKIALSGAPEIGWISRLFPEPAAFHLSLPDVLGLNGSWQWYVRGLPVAGLAGSLHPHYGVYFPTRQSHLPLFQQALRNTCPGNILDLGSGSGVLSFLTAATLGSAATVTGIDLNPNAIRSAREDAQRLGYAEQCQFQLQNFQELPPETWDLVLCNPPWLPGPIRHPLDTAIYYQDDFFPALFEITRDRISSRGTFLLVFSNFAQAAGLTTTHPIQEELARNTRWKQAKFLTQPAWSSKKITGPGWQRRLRQNEQVEIWALQPT